MYEMILFPTKVQSKVPSALTKEREGEGVRESEREKSFCFSKLTICQHSEKHIHGCPLSSSGKAFNTTL